MGSKKTENKTTFIDIILIHNTNQTNENIEYQINQTKIYLIKVPVAKHMEM